LAASLLFGCSSLGDLGSSLNPFNMSSSQVESLGKTAQAVSKSFEDITPSQEYYIGRAVAASIFASYSPYAAAKANTYVNLLGQTLAVCSDRPETYGGYHFQILDSDAINAFAAPGGLILVTRGLLRCAENEDEAAAILAHEIGHVVKQHGLQAIKTSRITAALTSAALTAAETVGPSELRELTSVFGDSIDDITSTLVNSGYSRAQELEADQQAAAILKEAGYDPHALVQMLKVMETKLKPGGLDFSKTHPDPEVRIKAVETVLLVSPPAAAAPAQRLSRFKAALGGI